MSKAPTTSKPARALFLSKDHPRYRWIALSNTTLGMLMATINSSIVIISLPAIFKGINLNPLEPGNVGYLLWILTGYMLVTAVLVVTFGRLGDMYGRVRIYNLGFVVFTVGSIALAVDPMSGGAGAMWLIMWRLVQGVGGAMLFANSTAILTDAFPANRRGLALGTNQVAAIAGSFIGLIVGGVLATIDWRAVFFVSVPIGIIGTIWSYKSLHEVGSKSPGTMDWTGNIVFGLGLTALLSGITYGIQPYGGSSTGFTNPWVLAEIIGGIALLIGFVFLELHTREPMFDIRLFGIRAFALANLSGLLAAIGRGGMQFMLIIWLQGIWLPLHGVSLREHASVGGRLPAADHHWIPDCRSDFGSAVGSFWGENVRDGRPAARGRGVRRAVDHSGELRVLAICGHYRNQRDRIGPVQRSQPHRDHEQCSGETAGIRRGHGRYCPQRRNLALYRYLLFTDDRRPRNAPAIGFIQRAHRQRGSGDSGDANRADSAGWKPLCRLPRLQPDPGSSCPDRSAYPSFAGADRHPDRQGFLPATHLGSLPRRAGDRVSGGGGHVARRGNRIRVPRLALSS